MAAKGGIYGKVISEYYGGLKCRRVFLNSSKLLCNSMTPSEIAESTLRERHNITTLVDRLRQEGLVRTERNEKDKRSVNIILTGSGREVLSQSTPVAREIVDQVMLSISAGDAVLLEKPLRVLRQNACNGLEYLAKLSHPQPG